jgi:hypothetical protein
MKLGQAKGASGFVLSTIFKGGILLITIEIINYIT